jgi:hypothetical protein
MLLFCARQIFRHGTPRDRLTAPGIPLTQFSPQDSGLLAHAIAPPREKGIDQLSRFSIAQVEGFNRHSLNEEKNLWVAKTEEKTSGSQKTLTGHD